MKKTFSKLSSDTISALRFPLMVGIVFIHVGIGDVLATKGIDYTTDTPQWYRHMVDLFGDVLPRIGVPLFFLMSGFLFFRNEELTVKTYKNKLGKRIKTLLVPYVLWNAIAILRDTVTQLPLFSAYTAGEKTMDWSVKNFLGCFYDAWHGVFRYVGKATECGMTALGETTGGGAIYPQNLPLWYVRDLMIIVLFAPLFYCFIRRFGWYVVFTLGVVWFFIGEANVFGYSRQIACGAFFFSWGACYAMKGMDFVASMRRMKAIPFLYVTVAVTDMLTKGTDFNSYIHQIGIMFGIPTVVMLTASLLERGRMKQNKFFADSVFFIYSLHWLIVAFLGRIMIKLWFVDSPLYFTVLYFLVPAITIAVCLALYWLLRRYAPKLCAVLTGGR